MNTPRMAALDWLARRAELSPDRLALIDADTGERRTYREWNEAAERAAICLAALGVERGDRVAVLAENAPAVLDLLFACGKLGALFMPLGGQLDQQELERQLAHALPRALLSDQRMDERARALALAWMVTGRPAMARMSLEALAHPPEGEPPPRPLLKMSDPWLLCHTAGTTGAPRPVVHTHASITWNAISTAATWGLGPGDLAIVNAPLSHASGVNVLATPLVHAGGASILCRRLDADQMFDLIGGGATALFGAPAVFGMLEQHRRWPGADLSRLRLALCGGTTAPSRLFESFAARGACLRATYDLTEAGPNNFWAPDELARARPGTLGYPLLHVEARLVDADGWTVHEPDRVGEIYLRGPHLMDGYFDDPEATAHALGPDGWLATGDLARLDAGGAFWMVGRRGDSAIAGREDLAPGHLEHG